MGKPRMDLCEEGSETEKEVTNEDKELMRQCSW